MNNNLPQPTNIERQYTAINWRNSLSVFCETCNTYHHNDKVKECFNCTMKVCTLCLIKCSHCKIHYCPACNEDGEINLLRKKTKKRFAITIPGYGTRITDNITEDLKNYKIHNIQWNYYLCESCDS